MSGAPPHQIVEGDFLHASLYFDRLTTIAYSGAVDRHFVPHLRSAPVARLVNVPGAGHEAEPVALSAESVQSLRPPPTTSEVMTLHSYNSATYFGSNDGLWRLTERVGRDLDADYDLVDPRPSLDMDTAFGVGAVAHGYGLSILVLEAQWLSMHGLRPSSDESDIPVSSVSWSYQHVIGQDSPFSHEVFHTDFELQEVGSKKHWVFRRLGESSVLQPPDRQQAICAVGARSYATWNRADNSTSIYAKRKFGWPAEVPESGESAGPIPGFRLVGALSGRALTVRELGGFLVCEMADRVSLVGDEGVEFVLLDQPATDVRVYPRSNRYRGIVTAISEIGVHVLDASRLIDPT